jgi:protein-L-isoaspartate(D-aspartate) O-methyltransferase
MIIGRHIGTAWCWPGLVIAAVLLHVAMARASGTQQQVKAQQAEAAPDAHQQQVKSTAPEKRSRPRTDEFSAQRRAMVSRQIEARGVFDKNVLQAMHSVPRHWFVPDRVRDMAYADSALPIGEGQTISQPYIVACMTEALKLTPSSKVLEIGTGSGYQAAVLSELTPHVFTIEIVEPLGRRAIETFKRHGYKDIQVRIGDGYAGWAEQAPFDAIIVTCAPTKVPPRLVKQLKRGGRMCIPVGGQYEVQELQILTKDESGALQKKAMIPVRFVPMTGEAQRPTPDTSDE